MSRQECRSMKWGHYEPTVSLHIGFASYSPPSQLWEQSHSEKAEPFPRHSSFYSPTWCLLSRKQPLQALFHLLCSFLQVTAVWVSFHSRWSGLRRGIKVGSSKSLQHRVLLYTTYATRKPPRLHSPFCLWTGAILPSLRVIGAVLQNRKNLAFAWTFFIFFWKAGYTF